MAIGTLTLVEKVEASGGPLIVARCNMVGVASYATGGNTGLLAALQALLGRAVDIISVRSEGSNGDDVIEYVHSSDKVFHRVMSTGLEVANATDLSATTYGLCIICKLPLLLSRWGSSQRHRPRRATRYRK